MMEGRFVTYLRVSTDRQGKSGLGLDAQRTAVAAYLNGGAWATTGEYVEIESGKNNARPELAKAIKMCRLTGARLLIAKLDRLSRNAAFLLNLRDSGIEFVAADMPDANRMTVGIMAVVAEHEREMIASRTKAALAAAKARGQVLGGYRGGPVPDAKSGGETVSNAADTFAKRVGPMAQEMRQAGMGLATIAAELTAKGIRTARGGAWTATAVRNVLARSRCQ